MGAGVIEECVGLEGIAGGFMSGRIIKHRFLVFVIIHPLLYETVSNPRLSTLRRS
jgi:hypothetical protein